VGAERLYLSATRISRRVRRANRPASAGIDDPAELEREIGSITESARAMLADFLASPRYRELIAALDREDVAETSRLIMDVFADIEPATPAGPLYLPLSAKRGESALEPDAGAEKIARMARDGIEPQHGPGVGGDANVHPIRFYEGVSGIDVAILIVVSSSAVRQPAFRARPLDELLIYVRRLEVPLSAALRVHSPDDWLELRAGGYAEYREKCRQALTARGITVEDV
jgi:hypothetical protein